jgi:hypothetical protein
MAWKVINEARIVKDDVTGAVGIQTGCPDVAVIGKGSGDVSGYSNGLKFKVPIDGGNVLRNEVRNTGSGKIILDITILIAAKDGDVWLDFWGGKLCDIVNFEELAANSEEAVFNVYPYELLEIAVHTDGINVTLPISYVDSELIGLPLTSRASCIAINHAKGVSYAALSIYNVYDASTLGSSAASFSKEIEEVLKLLTHITFPVTVYDTIESEDDSSAFSIV